MNGNYSSPLNYFPSAEVFFEREESLQVAEEYIKGVMNKSINSFVKNDLKFKMLGISGMKGIGKSELLKQISKRIVAIDQINVKSIYFTFLGGPGQTKSKFLEDFETTNNYCNSFGHILLDSCGVPAHLIENLSFAQSLKLYRSILKISETDVLLILVDEIGYLEPPHDILTIKSLMNIMDINEGKLIFIFAHTSQEFLNKQVTVSNRPVISLALSSLNVDIWRKIPNLVEASTKWPVLHQLFLSCSGHPRAIFDGFFY